MHVKRITLENFMRHDATTVVLPDHGVVLITGSNGSGKTSVQEAVATAVWGKTMRGTTPWRPKQAGVAEVELGDGLVIRRSRSKGGATELTLTGDVAERDTTNTKTQTRLESIVGDFETWQRTSVLSSADAATFTLSTDAERKRLIENLLNMDRFELALKQCRAELKPVRDRVRELDNELAIKQERLRVLRQKKQELDVVKPPRQIDKAPAIDPDQYRARIDELFNLAEGCRIELKERRSAVLDARGQAERAKFNAEQVEREAYLLDVEACPTCEQPLPAALIAKLRAKVDAARLRARKTGAIAKRKQFELSHEINDLEEEYEGLQARHQELAADLRRFESEADAADRAAQQAQKLEQLRKSTRQAIQQCQDSIAEIVEQQKQTAVELAELEAVEKVLSYEGVRAHVLGKALGGIEAVANSWLDRIAHQGFRLRLKPYRENKTGGVRDLISLDVDGAGGGEGYQAASGGERRRIDVALLFALAEVAAASRGVRAGTLFVDEVTDGLDQDGRLALADAFRDLGRDRCVVVISHSDDFSRQLRPDVHLVVHDGAVRHAGG